MLMSDIISYKLTLQPGHQQTMVSIQYQLSNPENLSVLQQQYV